MFAHLPGVKLEQCASPFRQHARMLWRVTDLGHVQLTEGEVALHAGAAGAGAVLAQLQ